MYRVNLFFLLLIVSVGFRAGAQPVTNMGTDFWVAFQPNTDGQSFILVINSSFECSGNISSAFNSFSQDFTVIPGTGTEITLPDNFYLTSGITDKGIHIVTTKPVSVVCHNFSTLPLSADSYLALPADRLGKDYFIMSIHGESTGGGNSNFCIVSTHDHTSVAIYNQATSVTEHIFLDRGQAYLEFGYNKDLTGSKIHTDYPVMVLSGNQLSSIPAGCSAADMVAETMIPTSSWGKEFYTVSLGGREWDGDVFRILAKDNLTVVKINDTVVATLNSGRYYETELKGMNCIRTTAPVMVAQFAKSYECSGTNGVGDPMMMLVPPRQQYATTFMLSTISTLSDWVNIVASPNAVGQIKFDGSFIPVSAFAEIGTSGYRGARLGISRGTHLFTATDPFQVFSYGWSQALSYGNPAGGSLSNLCVVANLTISPDSASGILNFTNMCFTATVTDTAGMPVEGIMVDFSIHGMGDIVKSLFTDSLGQATFCYIRTGNIPGMDSIYAEVGSLRSSTSRGYWGICMQPMNGGMVGYSQSNCTGFTPQPLVNLNTPSGQNGEPEFRWQSSTTDSTAGFVDIPGSNTPAFSPGLVTQTTWFRRLAKVTCDSVWLSTGISNVVAIMISNQFTPQVSLTTDSLFCEGTTKTMTAVGMHGGSLPSYQWYLNGTPAGSDSPVFSWPPSPGDSIRCVFTSSLTCVTVNPVSSRVIVVNPDLSHPAGITLSASRNPSCTGETVTISAVPVNGGLHPVFEWLVNGISTGSDNQTFSYIPADKDEVECRMTSDLECASGNPVISAPITMLVEQPPTASFSITPRDTSISAALITFTDESTGTTGCHIDWGDGTVTVCDTLYHRYLSTGIFIIKEIVSNDAGCYDSASSEVKIRPLPTDQPEYDFYIPNSFTPDGDGLNDLFRFNFNGVENFTLRIFDRFGEEIFTTKDPVTGWNGQAGGKPCPEDTYAYKITCTKSLTGEEKVFRGTVLLLRKH